MEKVNLQVEARHVVVLQNILEALDRSESYDPDFTKNPANCFMFMDRQLDRAADAYIDFESDNGAKIEDVKNNLALLGANVLRTFSVLNSIPEVTKDRFTKSYVKNRFRPFLTIEECERIEKEAVEMWEKYIAENNG